MERADRQRVILLGLLILIAVYFGYYGVGAFGGVSTLRAEAEKLQRERDGLRQQVQNAQVMVANLDRIKKEREALEIQLRELSRRLPSEPESAEVLRSVESLAGKSGLITSQVRRRPNRPQELYVEIPLEVSVGGGYYNLLKFAGELSRLPRLVTLNEIKVEASNTPAQGPAAVDGATGSMRAQVVAVVFQALATAGGAPGGQPAKP